MCTPKDVLDPSVDGQISYLCGRHDCSLLHFGDPVIGTVYDDRILVSSGQWWPLPRGHTPHLCLKRHVRFSPCLQRGSLSSQCFFVCGRDCASIDCVKTLP